MPIDLDDIRARTRASFRLEAEDVLAELDAGLLELESAPTDSVLLNRVFRAIHTLKGSGATAGYASVSTLLHHAEDIFDSARVGRLLIDSPHVDLVLELTDLVRKLLVASEAEETPIVEQGLRLIAALQQARTSLAPSSIAAAPLATRVEPSPADQCAALIYQIEFRPERQFFFGGNDPARLLDELLTMGVGLVRVQATPIPDFSTIDPELCYLSWVIQIATQVPLDDLQNVFAFVVDRAEVTIARVPGDEAWVLPPAAYFDPQLIGDFLDESTEDVERMESEVLSLEESDGDSRQIESVYRSLHNLKGTARLLLSSASRQVPKNHPIRAIADLSHAAEGYLEPVRRFTTAPLERECIQTLLTSVDWLKTLLLGITAAASAECPTELRQRLAAHWPIDDASRIARQQPGAVMAEPLSDVASLVKECREIAKPLVCAAAARGAMTAAESAALERTLRTLRKATIFESNRLLQRQIDDALARLENASRGPCAVEGFQLAALREAVVDLESCLSTAANAKDVDELDHVGVQDSTRPPLRRSAHPVGAVVETIDANAPSVANSRSVRVDQKKLDRLMRAVSELLVAKNALPVLAARTDSSGSIGKEVREWGGRITHIADELQDTVRSIRMMPIRTVFQRLPRLVRDLARSADKQASLTMSGDETELDKTVLEQISDPLVHLVRNAVDHGLESTAERTLAGKPAIGTVSLDVSKRGSHVVVRISDDGRGMPPDRLRAKAVERGLITADEARAMSDSRAYELVFIPGFSTADKVTDVSGRGVGMDVVRSNVEQLHGTITIDSKVGVGTTFTVSLPTSLMISKGILVECAGCSFVLPIENVRELVKLLPEQIHRHGNCAFACIRDTVLPVFGLAQILELSPGTPAWRDEQPAAIVSSSQGDVVVLVDRTLAEMDVIVKPLSGGLGKLSAFQGAAILGDGRVVLVLDPMRLAIVACREAAQTGNLRDLGLRQLDSSGDGRAP